MASIQTPVLIVGAGPTGLVTALSLAMNGIGVRIIDKEPKFHIGTRGPGIQARSQELFHLLGVLQDVQNSCLPMPLRRVYKLPGGTEVLEEGFMMPPAESTPSTPYINILFLSQMNTEGILRNQLNKYGVNVELGTELCDLEQNGERVTVLLVKHDGDAEVSETSQFNYVVGCDGGRSVTRKLLGLSFAGSDHQDEGLVVGEIEVEGLSSKYWHHWGDMKNKMLALLPTEIPGIFAFMAGGQVDYKLIVQDHDALVQFMYDTTDRRELKFGAVPWISEFRPRSRMVEPFGKGHVFVAGDAAHVHSFTGGQGLNSGVQDGFNLAWKLALVLKSFSPPTILETYTTERTPVIRAMLEHAAALLIKMHSASMNVRGSTIDAWARPYQLKQLGVNYRWSSIVVDQRSPRLPIEELWARAYGGAGPDMKWIQAGDRARDAPGLRVLVGGEETSTRLLDVFKPTCHTVLIFAGALPEGQFEGSVKTLDAYPNDLLRLVVVFPRGAQPPLAFNAGDVLRVVDEKAHAYHGYSINESHADADRLPIVVVRPDAVVGAVVFGLNSVEEYFARIFREGVMKGV